MADLKISQLTGATTPLAGTEVLPIVQSGSTRQVSVANLTAGRTQTSNGIVQGTAGTGYNFTANTPAAGMTSQLLNWYEEGTCQITLTPASGSITLKTTNDVFSYTRVGRLVTVTGSLAVASVSTPSGTVTLGGLPFTIANLTESSGNGAAPYWHYGDFVGYFNEGGTTVTLSDDGSTYGANHVLYMTFSYFA